MSEPADAVWRFGHASVAGSAHLREGRPCQDVGCCALLGPADGPTVLIAGMFIQRYILKGLSSGAVKG